MTFRPFNYAIASIAAFSVSLSSGNAAPADPSLAALHALETAPNAFSAVALARGNGAIFCTLGSKIKEKMVVDHERTAVLYSPEFRAWHGKGNVTNYIEIHSDINDLLYSMNNGRCSVAVENATNIIVIADALKQERMLFSVLPSPLQPAQLNDLYAKSLGFGSNADLMLATYMTANNEELQSFYKLGVTSKKAYDDALVRMRAAGYSQARHDLLAFLKDEAEGASRSLSATEIRDERNASAASAVK